MIVDYIDAHKFSSNHRKQLMNDCLCGCFYCLEVFSPSEINEWVDRDSTAICPYCNIDSIIGESSGYPINKTFLSRMNEHWF